MEAENGKQMDAMKVFSEMIKYFKNHLIKECEDKKTNVKEADIQFVITVPAIWTDPAKQFMREAAENVNLFDCLLNILAVIVYITIKIKICIRHNGIH